MGVVNGVPLPVIGTVEAISNYFGRWARVIPGRDKKENMLIRFQRPLVYHRTIFFPYSLPGNCSIEDHGLLRKS